MESIMENKKAKICCEVKISFIIFTRFCTIVIIVGENVDELVHTAHPPQAFEQLKPLGFRYHIYCIYNGKYFLLH